MENHSCVNHGKSPKTVVIFHKSSISRWTFHKIDHPMSSNLGVPWLWKTMLFLQSLDQAELPTWGPGLELGTICRPATGAAPRIWMIWIQLRKSQEKIDGYIMDMIFIGYWWDIEWSWMIFFFIDHAKTKMTLLWWEILEIFSWI